VVSHGGEPKLMSRRALVAATLLSALGGALPPPPAAAGELAATVPAAPATGPSIFPLSEVRPGMTGYGLTVFHGTEPERFEVEVVDVLRNYLAKQDLILVRCLGERFADHRIAQGMSGSPIFFDGRVAGALAYTWDWSKHALAGVTPIETMLAEGARRREGRPAGREPAGSPPTIEGIRAVSAGGDDEAVALRPIALPLCVSGFSASGVRGLSERLQGEGMSVRAAASPAGGAGDWADLDAPLVPGSALVVELMRGDYAATAVGTCTWVDGETVYGFGHAFYEAGETELPMSVGYVHTIVSSAKTSFKMGGALRPVGVVLQDRPSGIVGRTAETAPMIPFEVVFENAQTGRSESFRFEVTPNRLFTQSLVLSALGEAFSRAETTFGGNTKAYALAVKVAGLDEMTYRDVVSGFDRGLSRVLVALLDSIWVHPHERAELEHVRLKVQVEHVDRRAAIVAAHPLRADVRPGEVLPVEIRLRAREGGQETTTAIQVPIPAGAPAGGLSFRVAGGDLVRAEAAEPVTLADVGRLYAGFCRSTELVAEVPTGGVGVDAKGQLYRDVPLSALGRIARSQGGATTRLRPETRRVRAEVPFVVEGERWVTVNVRR
jgi:hypothetical protein